MREREFEDAVTSALQFFPGVQLKSQQKACLKFLTVSRTQRRSGSVAHWFWKKFDLPVAAKTFFKLLVRENRRTENL